MFSPFLVKISWSVSPFKTFPAFSNNACTLIIVFITQAQFCVQTLTIGELAVVFTTLHFLSNLQMGQYSRVFVTAKPFQPSVILHSSLLSPAILHFISNLQMGPGF